MTRKVPIVMILGSTATGKTKLSIDLAKRFGGEIISADSMQVYKGLDISTAKATPAERMQAVHHMLDVCDVTTTCYTVVDFRNTALPIINQLLAKNKMPIVVGGTNYYIESLLWEVLVEPAPKAQSESESDHEQCEKEGRQTFFKTPAQIVQQLAPEEISSTDPISLHNLLGKVDPDSAEKLHPNNTRKVLRALEVFARSGERLSDVIARQKAKSGGSYLGGPLRYEHTILFWLKSDQEKLNVRIDRRIDSMIADGMIFEIRKCYNQMKEHQVMTGQVEEDLDCTRGMMQAIGFKEFVPYLKRYPNESKDVEITNFIKSHGGTSGNNIRTMQKPEGLELLEECLEELRMRTKRYSKTQIKWVKNRFLTNKGRYIPPIYVLDATNAETNWHDDVYAKAEDVVQSYINDEIPQLQAVHSTMHPHSELNQYKTYFCDSCDRRLVGEHQWNIHIKSNTHKKVLQRRRREEARQLTQKQNFFRQILRDLLSPFRNLIIHLNRLFGR